MPLEVQIGIMREDSAALIQGVSTDCDPGTTIQTRKQPEDHCFKKCDSQRETPVLNAWSGTTCNAFMDHCLKTPVLVGWPANFRRYLDNTVRRRFFFT